MPSGKRGLSVFQQAVITAVRAVPIGRVVSYGQIAAAIGSPRAARQVGWAMASIGPIDDFPWWRVINNAGRITINNEHVTPQQQRELLAAEGILANDHYSVDIEQYRYRFEDLTVDRSAIRRLDDKYFQ
jgi:methylated-DNA-protein-cysteine methyltransferase-like protein